MLNNILLRYFLGVKKMKSLELIKKAETAFENQTKLKALLRYLGGTWDYAKNSSLSIILADILNGSKRKRIVMYFHNNKFFLKEKDSYVEMTLELLNERIKCKI